MRTATPSIRTTFPRETTCTLKRPDRGPAKVATSTILACFTEPAERFTVSSRRLPSPDLHAAVTRPLAHHQRQPRCVGHPSGQTGSAVPGLQVRPVERTVVLARPPRPGAVELPVVPGHLVQLRTAGLESASPSASSAATVKVWVPEPSPRRASDVPEQGRSRLLRAQRHDVAAGPSEVHASVVRREATTAPSSGPAVIVVSGATAVGTTAFDGALVGPVPISLRAAMVNV